MKVVQINSFPNGSTGKIMLGIHKELLKRGIKSYAIWFNGRNALNDGEIYLKDSLGNFFHKIYSRISGKQGFASWKNTKKLINIIEKIKPDIVHLHNLHSSSINIEILFNYLNSTNIKIFWTFHDCWAFTGKCVYFDQVECSKWKTKCYNCPLLKESPHAYIDNSNWSFNKKKKLFANSNLTIITPSNWLYSFVKQSFLTNKSVYVINNGININIFKKTKSTIREKYDIKDKKILLGVASPWSQRKGLKDFIKLANILDEDYVIFLVGLSQKQISILPKNIIGITRTENQEELASIYSEADLFVNLTYEDNYPTVNLESIACGTPVLTYDTGGSIEFVKFIVNCNENYVIKKVDVNNNINVLKKRIETIINCKQKFKLKDRNLLSEEHMVNEYIELYDSKLRK